MSHKRALGVFLLSAGWNLILVLVLFAEDYWGPPKGSLRRWIVAALILVIVGNLVSIVYLLYQRYGKRSEVNKEPLE